MTNENSDSLIIICALSLLIIPMILSLIYFKKNGILIPNCREFTVLAAYQVNNGGSPYFKLALKDEFGKVSNQNYWSSVPYIGEKIKFCN